MQTRRLARFALTAVALGLAPLAQAAPTPVTGCTTISSPGSYALQATLQAAGTDCLVIDAPFVSLDLRGFAIVGSGPGAGIRMAPGAVRGGIEIRNGTIADFYQGHGVNGALVQGGVIVEKMRLIGNRYGALLGPRSTARDNLVRSARNGLDLGDYATVHGNDVSDFVRVGISAGAGSRVTDNDVARKLDERRLPVPVDDGGSVTLDGNDYPPQVDINLPDLVLDTDSGDYELAPLDPVDPTAEDAQKLANPYEEPEPVTPEKPSDAEGLGIEAGEGSTIARNTVLDAVYGGIRALAGSTVVHNTTRGHVTGIHVDCPAAVIGNTSTANSFLDIHDSGSGCKLSQNAP